MSEWASVTAPLPNCLTLMLCLVCVCVCVALIRQAFEKDLRLDGRRLLDWRDVSATALCVCVCVSACRE